MCEILPERLRPEKVFRLYSDATAGRGICQRQGPGKVRHLSIRNLWIQDLVEKRAAQIAKIKGTENVADLLTKAVSRSVLEHLRPKLSLDRWGIDADICAIRGSTKKCTKGQAVSALFLDAPPCAPDFSCSWDGKDVESGVSFPFPMKGGLLLKGGLTAEGNPRDWQSGGSLWLVAGAGLELSPHSDHNALGSCQNATAFQSNSDASFCGCFQ